MRFFFFIVIFVFSFFSCSHNEIREPAQLGNNSVAQMKKPIHLIVTIHGLGGNEKTWGNFSQITTEHLNLLQPQYENKITNFIYATGNSQNLDTFDFANSLSTYIKEQFNNTPPGPQDRISLVCHSQGGLIGYIWLVKNLLQNDLTYINHVDSIITLGTPFWGSKLATIATDKRNFNVIPFVRLFAGESYQVSQREVEDLAFGSETIYYFRQLAIKVDSDPKFAEIASGLKVKLVNISGLLPKNRHDILSHIPNRKPLTGFVAKVFNAIYDFLNTNLNGKARVESDIAVITPSSRWNFLYAKNQQIENPYEKGLVNISEDSFQLYKSFINQSKFIITDAVHVPFDGENTYGMAYINKDCLNIYTCKHPTYRYILEELAGCPDSYECNQQSYSSIINQLKIVNIEQNRANEKMFKNLQTFSIQLNLKLDPYFIKTKMPVHYLRQENNLPNRDPEIDSWELYEPSLVGSVIDLNYNSKTQISKNSAAGNYNIHLGDANEQASVDVVGRTCNTLDGFDRIKIHLTGFVEKLGKKLSQEFYTVPITLRIPGLKEVHINARVKPGYSTFAEIDYSTQNIGVCKPY